MRIAEIMNRGVHGVEPNLPAEEAWEHMRVRRIRHLVVLEDHRVVGVISDRDLGGPNGAELRKGRVVSDLMSTGVVTARPETTLKRAAAQLKGYVIGCLPVVEGDKLVGIVTISDLLDLLARGAERPVPRSKRWTLKHRGPRFKPARLGR